MPEQEVKGRWRRSNSSSSGRNRQPSVTPPVKERAVWSLFGSLRQKGRGRAQQPLRGTNAKSMVKEIYMLHSHDSRHTINCECENI